MRFQKLILIFFTTLVIASCAPDRTNSESRSDSVPTSEIEEPENSSEVVEDTPLSSGDTNRQADVKEPVSEDPPPEGVKQESEVRKEPEAHPIETKSNNEAPQTEFGGDYAIGETMSAHIKHLNENKYLFTLIITSSADENCSGEVQGLISLSDNNVAAYKEDLMGYCELTLEFPGDYTLVVTEGECDLHGEKCGFGGVYDMK